MKKKILALLLTFILCFGLTIPVFADNQQDSIAIKNGVCIIQVNAWGHLEITNTTSISTTINGASDMVVVHTLAPTVVTMLTDVYGDSLGAYCYKVALNRSGGIDWDSMEETPIEIASGIKHDTQYADEIRYDAGAAYALEEGVYVLSAAMNGGLIINVSKELPSSWAIESVDTAIAAGLVPASLQFKYTQATTRAEFCALAVALYKTVTGEDIEKTDISFADTTDENVLKMASLGVVNGVGNDKFAPDQKLTREQAATLVSQLAAAIGKPLAEQAPTFADNASLSSWAVDAIGQMQTTGIMGGVGNNTFSPNGDYTREQSIITMMRLFDIVK